MQCEFVADVCEPYPIPIICELLGAPREDWKLFSSWATDIFRIFNANLAEDLPTIARAAGELTDYVTDMIAERRGNPRDDLLSDLIAIEEGGDRLSTGEMTMLAEAVLMAGTDTTRNQLACAAALFCDHPDQWALLAHEPQLAVRAVEESMRYLGAVRGTARIASEEIVYRDVIFPAGTLVTTSLTGANRDPDAWERPDVFDITLERGATQMTFGAGIHHCMGAALARAELQEALPILARRMRGPRSQRRHRVEAAHVRHLGTGHAPRSLRTLVGRTGAATMAPIPVLRSRFRTAAHAEGRRLRPDSSSSGAQRGRPPRLELEHRAHPRHAGLRDAHRGPTSR